MNSVYLEWSIIQRELTRGIVSITYTPSLFVSDRSLVFCPLINYVRKTFYTHLYIITMMPVLNRKRYARRRKAMVPSARKPMATVPRSLIGSTSQNSLTLTRDSQLVTHSFQRGILTDVYDSGALTFSADKFPNIAELTSLFDEYRINWVRVKFLFQGTDAPFANPYFAIMPVRLAYAIDYDDSTAPAASAVGFSAIQEYNGCKNRVMPDKSGSTVELKFTPKMLNTVYRAGVSSAYAPVAPVFLDIDNANDVSHYGLKWVLLAPMTSTSPNDFLYRYDTVVTYNITFRGSR